jgi:Terminase RNaseH-like domain
MKLREPGLPTVRSTTVIQSELEAIFLHPKQMEVFRSPHRFRVVTAGRRWGKTQLAKVSLIKYAKVPRRLVWYVAPSYRMAKQIMWPDLLASVPRKWIKKVNETTLTIILVNGSRIELKGADNPDSLRGVGIHFLVLDEVQDINPEAWKKVLRPTLASTGGHALFIGTPKAYNFLYDLYMLGQRGAVFKDDKGVLRRNAWMSWQFPTITSPFIPASEIDDARADMDEKSFNQEFMASFETMSGRVYYPFERKIHVGKYPFNPALPIWVGQDFNIDPMSSCILQAQENGDLWVVHELALKSSNTEEVCDELERLYWKLMNQVTVFPDPAGSYRQHARGESDLDIFKQKGFKHVLFHKKHPPVADRINAVNRMLKSANGKVRLYVNSTCKEVIRALEQTIYQEGGREVDKSMGVDHMGDALGYPVQYMFPVRELVIAGVSI